MDYDFLDTDILDEDDSERDFHESFKKINQKNNDSDLNKIKQLKNQIKNYDIYDFINSVSALNLIPNNQSKSVIFNTIISTALSIPKKEINFSNKMSMGKFKKIIKNFEDLDIKRNIDPAEFPFMSKVFYYNNYNFFMGVSTISTNSIQLFLNGLKDNWNKLDKETLNKLNTNIELLLNISTFVSKDLDYDFDKFKKISYDNPILVPSSEQLNKLKDKLVFSNSYLSNYIFDVEEFNSLFCDLNCCENNSYLDFDNQNYFLHPLLKYGNNAIILDITLFPLILMHKLASLCLKDTKRVNLIDEYSKNTVSEMEKYFRMLGNFKIKESEIPLELINFSSYKEVLFSTGNDGIIVNVFLIDDGKNFNENKLVSNCENLVKMKYIEERLKIIYDKLIFTGVKEDNIFVIITYITLGRTMSFSLSCDYRYKINLSPYELRAISINEASQNLFLQRYMISKSKLKEPNQNLFSELNLIVQYVSRDYSFYLDDMVDIKNTMLMYVGEFSAEYIYKSEQKLDEQLIPSYEDGYNSLVIKNENNIYYCANHFANGRLNLCIKTNKVIIWLLTEEIKEEELLPVYTNILDLLSYWLNEYIEIFNSHLFAEEKLVIEVNINGDKNSFFYNKNTDKDINDILNVSFNGKKIILNVVPELIWKLNCNYNKNEKEIFVNFIQKISDLININLLDNKKIEDIFSNQYKKKSVAIDYSRLSYLKPFSSSKDRVISSSDINIILDEIGLYVINDLKYEYGALDKEKNDDLSKTVVGKLYTEIYEQLKKCNKELTLKLLYYESERITSNMMIQRSLYKNNVACYPNQKKEIDERFNESNRSSLAIKFLIELFSSLPSTGDERLDEYQLEFLLAKSSNLIDWAYRNDLYHYNIINTHMEVLKSNRIGVKHEEIERANRSFSILRKEQMENFDKGKLQEILDIFEEEKPKNEEFDIAFKKEFGFSIDNLFKFFWYLIEQGENEKGEVFEKKKDDIVKELSSDIPPEEIEKIFERFSLRERENFLNPPKPYRKEDAYPWRFNRELSFMRRPLVSYQNSIIWGNRNLSNSIFFLFDLINKGKLNSCTKEMKDYISKVNNLRGKNFNNLVFEYIRTIKEFKVDKNVEKINNLKIEDNNRNFLGDIDVLFINLKKKIIVLVEAKDFNSVKNYYELYNEYQNMFLDNNEKKCFATKHKKRVEWVKEHINDIIKHYSLEDGNWQVTYMFVTSEYCTANDVFEMNEKIYSINELNDQLLLNIK